MVLEFASRNYVRGMFKLTIILAVEAGDPAVAKGLVGLLTMPRIWARIWMRWAQPQRHILISSVM